MKIKYSNQVFNGTFQFAVGLNIEELDFPTLFAGDAILIRKVITQLDVTSAAPSVTGAGLSIFGFALSGQSQAVPANLNETEKLLFVRNETKGSTAAGGLIVSAFQGSIATDLESGLVFEPTFSGVYAIGHTVNITNAADTILNLRIVYDIVSLTSAEIAKYA